MPMSMEQTTKFMQSIAKGLDDILNGEGVKDKKLGFCLWVFEFGDPEGTVNYVSNAKRDDMIKAIDAWRKRQ